MSSFFININNELIKRTMYQPQSLLEAYHSIYQEPIVEEYLTEEEEICYEIADFLLDEGYSEEEILSLMEEEDFIDILYQIHEKMSSDDYASLSRHGKRRVREAGIEVKDSHEYTTRGGARTKKTKAVQSRRAERSSGYAPKTREREVPAERRAMMQDRKDRDFKVRYDKADRDAEKIYQDNKRQAASEKKDKTAAASGWERHNQAVGVAKKLAKGVGEYFSSVNRSKIARGLGKTSASDEAIQRKARMDAKKSVREDYFDYVADYLLENFEFESEEHFYQTMASLDEELINDIIDSIVFYEEVDEYKSRLQRGQSYERAQRAGAEQEAAKRKKRLGKGGLGRSVYGDQDYESKTSGRQQDAEVLRSVRDVRKEGPHLTKRQRRIKELSGKYKED